MGLSSYADMGGELLYTKGLAQETRAFILNVGAADHRRRAYVVL